MKRVFHSGILSAAIVAGCTAAHAQVYSQNIVSLHCAGSHVGWTFGPHCVVLSRFGLVGAQEVSYWTDSSGQMLMDINRMDQISDRPQVKTEIYLGPASFHLPLSLRWSAVALLLAFLTLGWFVALFLLRRGATTAHGPAQT
ncbi:MAG: hypothetical protein C5B50_29400 [Verrucomicrobia bacterium]|nr:MAG: hypothetical protein C5B50_29400 [Verrucomicrobiota bacterium]